MYDLVHNYCRKRNTKEGARVTTKERAHTSKASQPPGPSFLFLLDGTVSVSP